MIRPKSPINNEILEICPVLTKYEKEIMRLLHIEGKNMEYAAQHFEKSSSTISIQNKKAVEKYDKWASNEGKKIVSDIIKAEKIEEKSGTKKNIEQEKNKVEGELAAKVYKLFKKGSKPEDVVIILKQTPKVINQLYREFIGIPEKAPIKEFIDIRR
jgi:predicted DNA-binding protein (UPF0251 family)